jgi:ribonuclease HIII
MFDFEFYKQMNYANFLFKSKSVCIYFYETEKTSLYLYD